MKRALTAGIVVLAVFLLGVTAWRVRPIREEFYTDADQIKVPARSAPLRDILWQPPTELPVALNTSGDDYEPRLSADGLTLYFVRGKAGANADIYFVNRTPSGWSHPAPLIGVNSEADDLGPEPTADGQSLYFYSNRDGGFGGYDLWLVRREGAGWGQPANLGPSVNSEFNDYGPAAPADGSVVYFSSNRPQTADADQPDPNAWPATLREDLFHRTYDLYAATVAERGMGTAVPLAALNTPYNEGAPAVSPFGDFLYFASDRPDGHGAFDLYRSRRLRGEYLAPTNLGSAVNTVANELDPALSMGGYALYFSSDRVTNVEGVDAVTSEESAAPRHYNLYQTTSREVFAEAQTTDREPIDWAGLWAAIGPNLLWALLALLLLLAMLALYRSTRDRRLSLLAKCLLASMAAHLLLLFLLNAWDVAASLAGEFNRRGRIQVALAAPMSGNSIARQILGDITEIEAPQIQTVESSPAFQPPPVEVSETILARINPQRRPLEFAVGPRDSLEMADSRPADTPLAIPQVEPNAELSNSQAFEPRLPTNPQRPSTVETWVAPAAADPAADRAEIRPTELTEVAPAGIRPEPSEHRMDSATSASLVADTPMSDSGSLAATESMEATFRPQEADIPAKLLMLAGPVEVPPPVALTEREGSAPAVVATQAARQQPSLARPPTEAIDFAALRPESAARAALPADSPVVAANVNETPDVAVVARALATEPVEAVPAWVADPADKLELAEPAEVASRAPAAERSQRVDAVPLEKSTRAEVRVDVEPAVPTEPSPTLALRHALGVNQMEKFNPQLEVSDSPLVPEGPVTEGPRDPAVDIPRAANVPLELSLPASGLAPAAVVETSDRVAPAAAAATRAVSAVASEATAEAMPRYDARPSRSPLRDSAFEPVALTALSAPAPAPTALTLVDRDVAPPVSVVPGIPGLSLPVEEMPPDLPLMQRFTEDRLAFAKERGGSEATEGAVELALAWLAAHQSDDGRWDADGFDAGCGQCDGETDVAADNALTGLSLLGFLGAGHTPTRPGPYQENVRRGLEWLLSRQQKNGDLRGEETMYSHGIATIAISESYAMTGDSSLRDPVERAARFIDRARHRNSGGWRYDPGQEGDTSVLGWQVMALKSAQMAGVDVPAAAFQSARAWLKRVGDRSRPGLYSYQPGLDATPSMTAEAMFTQLLLGRRPQDADMRRSVGFILDHLPDWDEDPNTYFWYYASLALVQYGGPEWEQWNEAVSGELVEHQRRDGKAAGSWDPVGEWAQTGGRVYQTAICTLILEVYYRYLPLYSPDSAVPIEDLPEDIFGEIRGTVRDGRSGTPIGGATVRLSLADGPAVTARTNADGRYALNAPEVPEHFALSASADGHVPDTVSIERDRLDGQSLEVDFRLDRLDEAVVVLEAEPEVHHLGDDHFDGRINSQFQKQSEGAQFATTFTLGEEQVSPQVGRGEVVLLAKGVQRRHSIVLNGTTLDQRLDTAPDDGSFGEFAAPFDAGLLHSGENTLEIIAAPSSSDIDDFEFVNVRVRLFR